MVWSVLTMMGLLDGTACCIDVLHLAGTPRKHTRAVCSVYMCVCARARVCELMLCFGLFMLYKLLLIVIVFMAG